MGHPTEPREARFLYAEDFLQDGEWKTARLTIAAVLQPGELRAANKQPIMERVLRFDVTEKMLVLNRTNTRLLRIMIGTEKAEKWVGVKVVFYPAIISAFGESNVPCVRVMVPDTTPIPWGVRQHLGKSLVGVKV